ncbi:hypothetical protein BV898_12973 [Hypsibius exemplaris]|uniref:Uncharacterized protein n=1 Tax=Hypsibius exemplaris TaxID=2072580 RepID=A0A1W0WC50_HYPEX|nr:hypothetical protein BV898_12973 [Hypsibius exemplaris]
MEGNLGSPSNTQTASTVRLRLSRHGERRPRPGRLGSALLHRKGRGLTVVTKNPANLRNIRAQLSTMIHGIYSDPEGARCDPQQSRPLPRVAVPFEDDARTDECSASLAAAHTGEVGSGYAVVAGTHTSAFTQASLP